MRALVWIPAAVILAAAAAVFGFYRSDIARAERRLAGRSHVIETSRGRLEYADVGTGEPVLVIHGAGGGFDQSLNMTGELRKHGFRLLAPSRFGYLQSDIPARPTLDAQADAYAELLDRLHIQKAFVVSISAGAWSALAFAVRHPERCRGLVMLVPANYLPPNTKIHGGILAQAIFESDFAAWTAIKLTPLMPGALASLMLGTDPGVLDGASPAEKARVRRILEDLLPMSPRAAGMKFDLATAAQHDPLALERILCPVLAISAADDRFGTEARAHFIAGHVADGGAIVFPSGGHALVGHYADALQQSVTFMREPPPS